MGTLSRSERGKGRRPGFFRPEVGKEMRGMDARISVQLVLDRRPVLVEVKLRAVVEIVALQAVGDHLLLRLGRRQ